ncbi:MAG: D-sedoheptulose 7-phosphate isomerase [Bdellovibrionaceae bacterium]|nr:D-sedoheptulose 7-phosphate isomerase [Pseudobdellovibrionaceae bacterium]
MNIQVMDAVRESIKVKQDILADSALVNATSLAADWISEMYGQRGTFYAFGNGGSAADAQHLVAELVGRFYYDRAPLSAQALTCNTSSITCIGNDYSYEDIFSRQLEACGRSGDVVLALSTSGNSPNVLRALLSAKKMGLKTIGLTGATGGQMNEVCDLMLKVPSTCTPRIQEAHILLGHIVCELVEARLFPRP